MQGVAKTKLTPDMLTMAGVTLCLVGACSSASSSTTRSSTSGSAASLFIVGSVADILDGAWPGREQGHRRGAFLDSTFDRLARRRCSLRSASSSSPAGERDRTRRAFAAVIGSFLVSYTRAKAEALRLPGGVRFGSRVERACSISIGLFLAPWLRQWPIYLLAAIVWVTVIQRILFVRRQLRELAAGA